MMKASFSVFLLLAFASCNRPAPDGTAAPQMNASAGKPADVIANPAVRSQPPAESRSFATCRSSSGPAQIRLSGETAMSELRCPRALPAGTEIVTGASTETDLVLWDGTQIKIGANTSTSVDGFAAEKGGWVSLFIFLGRLTAAVTPQKGRVFELRSVTSVAGVRGTRLTMAAALDGETRVAVEEGVVGFQYRGRQWDLGAGKIVTTDLISSSMQMREGIPAGGMWQEFLHEGVARLEKDGGAIAQAALASARKILEQEERQGQEHGDLAALGRLREAQSYLAVLEGLRIYASDKPLQARYSSRAIKRAYATALQLQPRLSAALVRREKRVEANFAVRGGTRPLDGLPAVSPFSAPIPPWVPEQYRNAPARTESTVPVLTEPPVVEPLPVPVLGAPGALPAAVRPGRSMNENIDDYLIELNAMPAPVSQGKSADKKEEPVRAK